VYEYSIYPYSLTFSLSFDARCSVSFASCMLSTASFVESCIVRSQYSVQHVA
jgi:hypothetical protein